MTGPGHGTGSEPALLGELAEALGLPAPRTPVRRESHTSHGRRISGLRWGAADSRVLLLHGGSMNAHVWDSVLLTTPLDALALDLPGHGNSDWWERPAYLPEDLADAVAPVVEALTPLPAVVVGHSLGGLTALALAARHPPLVRRLVLVDVSPTARPEVGRAVRDAVSVAAHPSFEALLASVMDPARGDSPGLRRRLRLNARELPDGRWSWRHDTRATPEAWDAVFAAVPRGWEHAAAVRCPTLLLHGDRSEVLTDEDVARYRSVLPGLRVQVLPGGHQLPGERPAEVAAAIHGFLDESP